MKGLAAYEDPEHEGNSPKYRTGKTCVEPGCDKAAGTRWGPYWCFKHNVERIKRIDAKMSKLARGG